MRVQLGVRWRPTVRTLNLRRLKKRMAGPLSARAGDGNKIPGLSSPCNKKWGVG